MESSGETLCNYKNRLARVEESGLCRKFSFNIFACKPLFPPMPKAFVLQKSDFYKKQGEEKHEKHL